jgi:hypothetical protein
MKKTAIMLSVVAGAVSLSGCATVVSGTSQTLQIQALDAQTHHTIPGAMCNVITSSGVNIPMTSNPGSVNVARGKGPLQVTCKKAGYNQTQIGVGTSFNAWTIADVLFWPAFIVDGLDGAYSQYDQSFVTVLMSSKGAPYHSAQVGTQEKK